MLNFFLLCVTGAFAIHLDSDGLSQTGYMRDLLHRSIEEHINVTLEDSQRLAAQVAAQPWPGQNMISKIISAAEQTGLREKLEGTVHKLSLIQQLVDQGRRSFQANMIFLGFQIHVGVPLAFGPGLDIAFVVADCIDENGCEDPRSWTNNTRKVKKDTMKACGGVMGGGEPILFNWPKNASFGSKDWKKFMAPPHIEIVPLLIAGFGGYRYANGGMAEFGANFMNTKFELAGAVEMNPSHLSDGVHLVVFELAWTDLSKVFTHMFIDEHDDHTHAHDEHSETRREKWKLNAAGVGVLGYMECTCPKDNTGTDCPLPPGTSGGAH